MRQPNISVQDKHILAYKTTKICQKLKIAEMSIQSGCFTTVKLTSQRSPGRI